MIAYRLTVEDTASPALDRLGRGLAPVQLNPLIGRSARNTFVEHFRALNATRPNALGGRRTNYYLGAARATHFDVVADGVIISINQVGIAQRYFGGTIRAGKGISSLTGKPTKFLTIPARAEAHGKRASEFDGLVVLWGRNGPYALARSVRTSIGFRQDKAAGTTRAFGRGAAGGEVLFWLRREITQQPDPSVLPAEFAIRAVLRRDLAAYAEALWQRQNPAAN